MNFIQAQKLLRKKYKIVFFTNVFGSIRVEKIRKVTNHPTRAIVYGYSSDSGLVISSTHAYEDHFYIKV